MAEWDEELSKEIQGNTMRYVSILGDAIADLLPDYQQHEVHYFYICNGGGGDTIKVCVPGEICNICTFMYFYAVAPPPPIFANVDLKVKFCFVS